MTLLTAKSRITIGLACMLVTVLCAAVMIGLVPDRRSAILDGRANMCETLAVSSSDYVSHGELQRLEFLLESVVGRNDDVLSAGVRRANGELLAKFGDHAALWGRRAEEHSTATHVQVPIRTGQEKWGSVELCFRPLRREGVAGWLAEPWLRLAIFVAGGSYLLFFAYLGKMLQHLDPSKTVPRRVRAALDSLAEGLLVIDRNGRIVLANQALANWVGRPPDKLIGVKAALLGWVQDESGRPLVAYPWVAAIELEQPQAGVMLGLKHKGRPVRILMANASPVLGHDGKYRGVLVSFDDVTQLEETRKDLSKAKRAAEDANRAKSDFLARMSHEIRTPMNAILGYTDVLRRGFDESVDDRQEYLGTIHASGEYLLVLINDVLDLSKIESGRMELELSRHSPHQIITQVVSVLRMKAEEKGVYLEFACDGPLPETIQTDSVRLRQAIMNLVGNAIKFTDQGGVRIVAKLADGEACGGGEHASGTRLAVDVVDTGIGIEPTSLARVFDPFAQADTSITRRFGGTGLGLAISRQLARAMGGDLTVASQPGEGSTFTLTIDPGPLEGVRLVDAKTASVELQATRPQPGATIELPPSRVLVADDGLSNRKLARLVLRRAGAEVDEAENGQQAVEMALGKPYDVILMDMQMPVMDGYLATTKLRQRGYDRPVIALTAHAMQGDEEKCRAAGCSWFLTKPINIDRLLAAVAAALPPHESCRRPPGKPSLPAADHEPYELKRVVSEVAELACAAARPAEKASSPSAAQPEPPNPAPRDSRPPEAPQSDHRNGHWTVGEGEAPLVSNLPMDDAEFREIVAEFAERLEEKLSAMERALSAKDYEELAAHAHWLKGSGGTAGFDAFTTPAQTLEDLVKRQQSEPIPAALAELRRLAGRILIPSAAME